MELGAFSLSLAVKNIEESKVFYQKLGFEVIGGDQSQNWLIIRNGDHTIGLFQGMLKISLFLQGIEYYLVVPVQNHLVLTLYPNIYLYLRL